jgi:hypothetical protein
MRRSGWAWVFGFAVIAGCGQSTNTCPGGQDYIVPPECDVVDCHLATCDLTCATGTTCGRLDCTGSPQCRLDCQPDATCPQVDCRSSDVCFVDCHGAGSTCEVSCEGAQQCDLNCHEGAECLLHCGSATAPACTFDTCTGGTGLVDCGGGVIACNRPCP